MPGSPRHATPLPARRRTPAQLRRPANPPHGSRAAPSLHSPPTPTASRSAPLERPSIASPGRSRGCSGGTFVSTVRGSARPPRTTRSCCCAGWSWQSSCPPARRRRCRPSSPASAPPLLGLRLRAARTPRCCRSSPPAPPTCPPPPRLRREPRRILFLPLTSSPQPRSTPLACRHRAPAQFQVGKCVAVRLYRARLISARPLPTARSCCAVSVERGRRARPPSCGTPPHRTSSPPPLASCLPRRHDDGVDGSRPSSRSSPVRCVARVRAACAAAPPSSSLFPAQPAARPRLALALRFLVLRRATGGCRRMYTRMACRRVSKSQERTASAS